MRIRETIKREKRISRTDLLAILSFVTKKTKEKILAGRDLETTEEEERQFRRLIEERKEGKPLAYILNQKEFFSEIFYIDSRVLIPRPETEILVEEVLKILENKHDPTIVDMGTGSGAIAVVVAKHGSSRVVAVDSSLEALRVARINLLKHRVEHRVETVCSNLFGGLKERPLFDVVVANLPYVGRKEWNSLMEDVRDYEPEKALIGGEKGTEMYEEFLEQFPPYLKPDGQVVCEIGGPEQAEKLGHALEAKGFIVKLIKDYADTERVIVGSWINLS